MGEGQIAVVWEYLPKPIPPRLNSSDLPLEGRATATSLKVAIGILDQLKRNHGQRLIFVDIITRVFGT